MVPGSIPGLYNIICTEHVINKIEVKCQLYLVVTYLTCLWPKLGTKCLFCEDPYLSLLGWSSYSLLTVGYDHMSSPSVIWTTLFHPSSNSCTAFPLIQIVNKHDFGQKSESYTQIQFSQTDSCAPERRKRSVETLVLTHPLLFSHLFLIFAYTPKPLFIPFSLMLCYER